MLKGEASPQASIKIVSPPVCVKHHETCIKKTGQHLITDLRNEKCGVRRAFLTPPLKSRDLVSHASSVGFRPEQEKVSSTNVDGRADLIIQEQNNPFAAAYDCYLSTLAVAPELSGTSSAGNQRLLLLCRSCSSPLGGDAMNFLQRRLRRTIRLRLDLGYAALGEPRPLGLEEGGRDSYWLCIRGYLTGLGYRTGQNPGLISP
jgi:hypothetical protein